MNGICTLIVTIIYDGIIKAFNLQSNSRKIMGLNKISSTCTPYEGKVKQ
ncbi:MAG: hypothetical protein LC102_05930 [Ignavibacteriales bacterium]|nr:hypothetical protein [Ignavibacteria bacterium]MBZ0197886.1 hypothetical protein [Ignavibacteriaceae bacterium]MCZ2142949.1 hypothetical protein [Ignavibacteriales bacterium]WKZ72054.1 MAG: hypothetical protein QY308_10535 [Ignavibacteriaceae bacterium]